VARIGIRKVSVRIKETATTLWTRPRAASTARCIRLGLL
jgi:hypothetical protein